MVVRVGNFLLGGQHRDAGVKQVLYNRGHCALPLAPTRADDLTVRKWGRERPLTRLRNYALKQSYLEFEGSSVDE